MSPSERERRAREYVQTQAILGLKNFDLNALNRSIKEQKEKLDAAGTGEPASQLIGVTKESAKLNAVTSQASNEVTMAAAKEVSGALQANTAAASRSSSAMIALTTVIALAALISALTAWCRPASVIVTPVVTPPAATATP